MVKSIVAGMLAGSLVVGGYAAAESRGLIPFVQKPSISENENTSDWAVACLLNDARATARRELSERDANAVKLACDMLDVGIKEGESNPSR